MYDTVVGTGLSVSAALLNSFWPPVTISDTDSLRIQYVLEQMEGWREGGRVEVWGKRQKEKCRCRRIPPAQMVDKPRTEKRPMTIQRKVRLMLACSCVLMLEGMEGGGRTGGESENMYTGRGVG